MSELLLNPGVRLQATLNDIDRIATMRDPVQRNLWITQRYHTLSRDLVESLGGPDVNWCTFGCWASKTAGQSIRNEEVPKALLEALNLEDAFSGALTRFVARAFGWEPKRRGDVLDVVRDTLRSVSEEVAQGNQRVFEELAPVFARFLDDLSDSFSYDEAEIENFCGHLRPGPTKSGGQEPLKRAFRAYYRARADADERSRAQWMLLANCLVGFHEQTRLQPNIVDAINAPVDEVFQDRLLRLVPGSEHSKVSQAIVSELNELVGKIKGVWERAATRHAMNLCLPGGREISLGEDVPARQQEFPQALAVLDNPELVDVVQRFDPRLDSLIGSAANNWADLEDRMGFIVDLFRARQQDLALLEAPFSDQQMAELRAGQLPSGVL